MMRISYNPPSFGPLLLGVLAPVAAAFALSAAPALAGATNVFEAPSLTGGETVALSFEPYSSHGKGSK